MKKSACFTFAVGVGLGLAPSLARAEFITCIGDWHCQRSLYDHIGYKMQDHSLADAARHAKLRDDSIYNVVGPKAFYGEGHVSGMS